MTVTMTSRMAVALWETMRNELEGVAYEAEKCQEYAHQVVEDRPQLGEGDDKEYWTTTVGPAWAALNDANNALQSYKNAINAMAEVARHLGYMETGEAVANLPSTF